MLIASFKLATSRKVTRCQARSQSETRRDTVIPNHSQVTIFMACINPDTMVGLWHWVYHSPGRWQVGMGGAKAFAHSAWHVPWPRIPCWLWALQIGLSFTPKVNIGYTKIWSNLDDLGYQHFRKPPYQLKGSQTFKEISGSISWSRNSRATDFRARFRFAKSLRQGVNCSRWFSQKNRCLSCNFRDFGQTNPSCVNWMCKFSSVPLGQFGAVNFRGLSCSETGTIRAGWWFRVWPGWWSIMNLSRYMSHENYVPQLIGRKNGSYIPTGPFFGCNATSLCDQPVIYFTPAVFPDLLHCCHLACKIGLVGKLALLYHSTRNCWKSW